jgi:hypothetical protein
MPWFAQSVGRSAVIAAMVTGVVVATLGCSLVQRTYEVTFPARNNGGLGIDALPVRLVDSTGLIIGFQQASPGPDQRGWLEGVAVFPGDPPALVFTWLGGACDRDVSMTVGGTASSLLVTIQTNREAGGCRLVGITRSVLLELNAVVDPANVTFEDPANVTIQLGPARGWSGSTWTAMAPTG